MSDFCSQDTCFMVIAETISLDEVPATSRADCSKVFVIRWPSARKALNLSSILQRLLHTFG